jgi:hypothetical protein
VAQSPEIGFIDFYGLREVSESQVGQALGIKEGDAGTRWDEMEAEARLEEIPGVRRASLQGVCCHEGRLVLYVGIEEDSAPSSRPQLHPEPRGDVTLPQEIVDTYRRFMEAMIAAMKRGESGEDLSEGHSLLHDEAARALQERFIGYAEQYLERLKRVLRESADADERAVAATVIAYAPDKTAIVDDLLHGVLDADGDVRNAAARGLFVIGLYAGDHPELDIHIPSDPFIRMLNSLVWTDRNKGTAMLLSLTKGRDPVLLARLREEALDALIEMARWRNPLHPKGAYTLLGRAFGMSDEEIEDSWKRGERQRLIEGIAESQRLGRP